MAKLSIKIILTALFLLAAFLCGERLGDLVQERDNYRQECFRLTNQNDSLRNANYQLEADKQPKKQVRVYLGYRPGKYID
jgi:hypothetical protein